jgi:hypothetical protein
MRGAAAQHPPEAFNDVEVGARARQAIPAQMRMGCHNRIPPCPTMPGRMIDRDDDLGIGAGRRSPCNLPERPGKGRLEPRLFTAPGLRLTVGWLLVQPRRPLPCHAMEGRTTIPLRLLIPGPYQRSGPFAPQGGAQRRYEGKTRRLLAQQHARARLGFFLTPSALPGPPVASPDGLAESDTSADRDG